MKLRGSRTEQKIRDDLIRSNLSLQDGSRARLVAALEAAHVNVATAYVVEWIPEQAEDIYFLLISINELVVAEVPRNEGDIFIGRRDISEYEGNRSKSERLKLMIARSLIESGLARFS